MIFGMFSNVTARRVTVSSSSLLSSWVCASQQLFTREKCRPPLSEIFNLDSLCPCPPPRGAPAAISIQASAEPGFFSVLQDCFCTRERRREAMVTMQVGYCALERTILTEKPALKRSDMKHHLFPLLPLPRVSSFRPFLYLLYTAMYRTTARFKHWTQPS